MALARRNIENKSKVDDENGVDEYGEREGERLKLLSLNIER